MEDLFPNIHWTNLLIIPGLLIGYTIHELAHAFAAYFLGDYSQVERGKITLNPFRHISWFGFFAFLLFGFGWANPLEANPQNLKQKHLAMGLIAFAGPLASMTLSIVGLLLTLSVAAVVVYGSGATTDAVFSFLNFPIQADLPQTFNMQALSMAFTSRIAVASFWLAFTSLLPLPGLDGFVIIVSLIAYFRERKDKEVRERSVPVSTHPISHLINRYKLRNNISDIHFKLGTEYHETHKYDDAIARYRQAISADKNFGPAYVNLGLAYLAKGKRKEAIHAFRGTLRYADDQTSQREAWYQLHQLSEVSPTDREAAQESMAEMGASPWTDTKPRPNWLNLGIGSAVLLIAGASFYSYLLSNLIELLKA